MEKLKRSHVSILGLALLLAINATLLWGGAFPFLPYGMQTPEVLIIFYLLQSLSFSSTLLIRAVTTYRRKSPGGHMSVLSSGAPIFIGCSCLIATLYIPGLTMPLVCIGALLLGTGCAGYLVLLQRSFASKEAEQGTLYIILGVGFSAVVYFILALIPIAVTSFVIALILVPLCGLSIVLSSREIDFTQPMFEDVPQQNKRVYLNTIKGYWPSAVCVGCLGFISGLVRSTVLTDPALGNILNLMSMIGALLSSIALLILWKKTSFSLDVINAFRIIFPFITTSFLLLPFLGVYFLDMFAAAIYMVFSFSLTIMMVQCAQASRDIGINPVFIFGFFGTIVYFLQSIGFLMGTSTYLAGAFGYHSILVITLGALWLLSMAMFFVRGQIHDVYSMLHSSPSRVEFIQRDTQKNGDAADQLSVKKVIMDDVNFKDRISKRCAVLKHRYMLSTREAEVMELIARGYSGAHIAEVLVVSENTVRTHSRRIYTKLDIHKRQELHVLLESVDLSTQ